MFRPVSSCPSVRLLPAAFHTLAARDEHILVQPLLRHERGRGRNVRDLKLRPLLRAEPLSEEGFTPSRGHQEREQPVGFRQINVTRI